MHYSRWKRHGDPLVVQRVQAPDGEAAQFYQHVVLPYKGAECLFWPFARHKSGYARMWFDGGNRYVHRRLCEDINGPPPNPDDEAAHSCGNGTLGCVAGNHLGWKTRLQNEADKIEHGTVRGADKRIRTWLTIEQVRRMRPMFGSSSDVEIANLFDVDRRTVQLIRERKTWAWLD